MVTLTSLLLSRLDDGAQQTGTQAPMTAPPGVFRDVSSSGINGAYRAYSQWAQTLPLCITKNNTDVRPPANPGETFCLEDQGQSAEPDVKSSSFDRPRVFAD